MANPFDQFDAPDAGNPFDKFGTSARGPSYSMAESAAGGVLKGLSANWRDEIEGAHAAAMAGLPERVKPAAEALTHNPIGYGMSVPVGAARLAYEHFTKPAPTITDLVTGNKHKGEATKAYESTRDEIRAQEAEMARQNPYSFMGGDIAGTVGSAIAMPEGILARGAANLPRARTFEEGLRQAGRRIAGAAESGATYGTIAGTGEGEGAQGTLTQGALGAGLGAGLGAAGGVLGEALRPGFEKLGNLWRGYRDTDAEAAKRIAQAHLRGRALGAPLTPEENAAADAAGLPRVLADMAGQPGRALLRSAANTSPEAWQTAADFTAQRYAQRATRNATFIRNLTGGGDTAAELELLEQQAAAQNSRAYQLAMRTGRQNLWEDPEIQRLAQAPDIRRAILTAGRDEGNRGIMAGNQKPRLNPFVRDENDNLALRTSSTGKSTAAADIAFWDGVKKRLGDWEGAARRSGRDAYARDLGILRRSLVQRLDAVVPEYQAARQGAAGFFGAEDAIEAGHNFFRSNISNPRDLMEARQAFNRLGPAEQTLFRRAYASRLADTIEQSGNLNALEAAFRGPARQRTTMVLKPGATNQLEALLRAEYAVDKTRMALKGSTTVAQYAALGLAGGAADLALEKHFDPSHFFLAALAGASTKQGVKLIDERVAKRVGEMLMSNDPGVLNQGTLLASRNPGILNALRQITQKLSGVGGGAGAVAFHPGSNQRQQGFKHGGMITADQDQRQHFAEGGDADDLSDWTPPPGPTPGETYAAFGDTGPIRGETEGVSPAMRAMIRRNMGRRLYDQTMAEREQTAEHALRGSAGVAGFVNPIAGAATAGATSRFMGDTPTETAGQVAQSLLPYAGGRLLAAAPKTAAATYGAGATMLPGSTQPASGETAAAIREQRRLEEQKAETERLNRRAAQKQKEMDAAAFKGWLIDPGNSKAMEGLDPLIVSRIKGAPDLATAQDIFSKALGEKRDAQHLSEWKQENAGAIGGLADTWQKRIAGAGSYNEAKAIFDEGALARKKAAETLAERYPEAMTLLEVAVPFASMALPAWSRNRQLNALERSAEKGEQLHTETFGEGAPELTQGRLNAADAAARNIRAGQDVTSFNPLKPQSWQEHLGEIAGGTAVAYAGNTGLPGLVDYAMGSLSSDPGGAERARKAWENMTSKERWEVAAGEGLLGTVAGNRLTDWRRSPVFARAQAARENLEHAPRNVSPGSTLTEATKPGAPGLPEPPPVAPPGAPVPEAAPPSPRSFPPAMFTHPPPVEQMAGYGKRADGTPIDMDRLKGGPLNKHLQRIRRDAGFARGGRVDVHGLSMSTRKESNYSPTRGTPNHHCGPDAKWPHGFCEMYRKHNKCSAVAGFIATKGGCDWYKRAAHRAAGGRAEGDPPDDDDVSFAQDYAASHGLDYQPLTKTRGEYASEIPGKVAESLLPLSAQGPSEATRREFRHWQEDQLKKTGYAPFAPWEHGGNPVLGAAELGTMLPFGAMGAGAKAAVAGAGKLLPAIFAGPMAKTADLAALKSAQEMLAKGATRDDIWNATGWFQGADSKWRFEIPDNAMKHVIKPLDWIPLKEDGKPLAAPNLEVAYNKAAAQLAPHAPVRVKRLFEHPELDRAYPFGFTASQDHPGIMGMPVGLIEGGNASGALIEGERGDILGLHETLPPGTARSATLHELQHAVQKREGFAPGRNIDTPHWEAGPDGPVFVDPREAYRRSAGEAEARNVQTRMNFTPEERRAKPPWETEDVPREQQIVRFK